MTNKPSNFALYDFWVFLSAYQFDVEKLASRIETVFNQNADMLNSTTFLFIPEMKFNIKDMAFKFEKLYIDPNQFVKVQNKIPARQIFFVSAAVNGIYHITNGKPTGLLGLQSLQQTGIC